MDEYNIVICLFAEIMTEYQLADLEHMECCVCRKSVPVVLTKHRHVMRRHIVANVVQGLHCIYVFKNILLTTVFVFNLWFKFTCLEAFIPERYPFIVSVCSVRDRG